MGNKIDFDHKKVKYTLREDGQFDIGSYNFSKSFSSFFPGIAGLYGIPMWVFYVNRGQCIVSFGTNSKDQPILEFQPANKAYQMVFQRGFRTFLKIKNSKARSVFYEPFQTHIDNFRFKIKNTMSITFGEVEIQERNESLGLETRVSYFTVPSDNFAALVRILTVKNISAGRKKIDLIDGLPIIIPYGLSNMFMKKLSRTIEAWMHVENLEKSAPFYRLPIDPTDRPEIIHIKKGNFYLSFSQDKEPALIKPIVDPDCVFGGINDLSFPYYFLKDSEFKYPKNQITQSKTPSALAFTSVELKKGQEFTLYSIIGNMGSLDKLNSSVARIANKEYIQNKRQESKVILSEVTKNALTVSSSAAFNHYVQGTFMDNVLRGGLPITLDEEKTEVVYVFSRKHGDLERDYNKFVTQPTYFSQGDGNYRDVNQNRRNDIFFNTDLKDSNIIDFFNLIQLDGFNPLVIKGIRYHFGDSRKVQEVLDAYISQEQKGALADFLTHPFHIGELFLFLEDNGIEINNKQMFIQDVLASSITEQDAEHKEGFWTDHWAYNTDLLERYLALYPENLRNILLDKREFTFYDDYVVVNPRSKKYVLYHNKPRQLNSLAAVEEKRQMILGRSTEPHKVRKEYGKGEIFATSLLVKLTCIVLNKLASLDPFGAGIEMEANKPNWYDALNGLPALFGSSANETMELKRLVIFIEQALQDKMNLPEGYTFSLPEEIFDFYQGLNNLLQRPATEGSFNFWDEGNLLKEEYRRKVIFGLSGKERDISIGEFIAFLEKARLKLEKGISAAFNLKSKVFSAYFINEVVEYDQIPRGQIQQPRRRNNDELVCVTPRKFKQKPLPLFLEGFVHAFRIAKDEQEKRDIYRAVKDSRLYDKKLNMYKVNSALEDQPEELGRARVFTPGWLENESIWLHMEYKYFLELLKAGLFEEFYKDFFGAAVPFQDPRRYGRSILENSSFIVSSVFPDEKLHGNGFVARLSGSTAELIHIWLIMNVGPRPFFLDNRGELGFEFAPILHKDLFTKKKQRIFLIDQQKNRVPVTIEKNCYGFMFLGKTLTVYHNPKRLHTFGRRPARAKKIVLFDGENKFQEINSNIVAAQEAHKIREGFFSRIDVYLY